MFDVDPLAPLGFTKPPLAAPAPVTETLYGTTLTDRYRYFEQMGPDTVAWMKSQGDYTRSVFDSIAPRAALLQRIADFAGRFGFVQGYSVHGGRAFYEERAPGADEFDLMVRDANGGRARWSTLRRCARRTAACRMRSTTFLPAPDGSKVAVGGISAGGSEAASLFVYLTPLAARRSRRGADRSRRVRRHVVERRRADAVLHPSQKLEERRAARRNKYLAPHDRPVET